MNPTPSKEQFMIELNRFKNGQEVWGTTFDLLQSIYVLRYHVNAYFDDVPDHISRSIRNLDLQVKIAVDQFEVTINKIIHELEKMDGLDGKNEG